MNITSPRFISLSPATASSSNDLGYFADPTALTTAYPTADDGNFAVVGSTDTVWVWDSGTVAWVDTGITSTDFSTNKATIVDGDKVAILDSAAADAPKHSLFSLIKSTLKTYFDTLYHTVGGALGTPSSGTLTSCTGAQTAIIIACSDESTALTTGAAKITFRMPRAFTVTGVRASVGVAPTGSLLIVDINDGGVSILSTKLSIDIGELTSTTAATPAVISDAALGDDAEITVDIDQIGSTVAGAGLKVELIGYYS